MNERQFEDILQKYPEVIEDGLTRGIDARHQGAGVPDHGALDSRSARLLASRTSQLRRRRGYRRPARLAARVVRPLAEGDRQQRWQAGAVCHAGADFRNGKRRWT